MFHVKHSARAFWDRWGWAVWFLFCVAAVYGIALFPWPHPDMIE